MQLCKKNIYRLMVTNFSDNPRDLEKAEYQMNLHEKKLQKYVDREGMENSCHIHRDEFGEDISLISEIVYKQVDPSEPLFPRTNESSSEGRNASNDSLDYQERMDNMLLAAPKIQVLELEKAKSSTCDLNANQSLDQQ